MAWARCRGDCNHCWGLLFASGLVPLATATVQARRLSYACVLTTRVFLFPAPTSHYLQGSGGKVVGRAIRVRSRFVSINGAKETKTEVVRTKRIRTAGDSIQSSTVPLSTSQFEP